MAHPVKPIRMEPLPPGDYPPSCADMVVSDPKDWSWSVWVAVPNALQMSSGFHRSNYTITFQYRYLVEVFTGDPDFPFDYVEYGPYQASITVNVENMVVETSDEKKVLRWDEKGALKTHLFLFKFFVAQKVGLT